MFATAAHFERLQDWLHKAKIDVAYDHLIGMVERSPVPRLAPFLDLVIFSFLYFIILDLFIYYILAPQLVKLMPNEKKSRGLDELNHGGSLKLKWAHMVPSFIHALIVGPGSIYFALKDPNSLSATRLTRLSGFSPEIGNMLAFSIGYFLWDVLICLFNPSVYGSSFLLHAIMALAGLVGGFRSDHGLTYYTNKYLMFEVSTIFVDFHWFFAKTGFDKTKRQKTADILGLLSYLVIRMAYGYYTSYQLLSDLVDWYKSGTYQWAPIIIASALQALTHVLNLYWFLKLAKSAIKSPTPKQKTQ